MNPTFPSNTPAFGPPPYGAENYAQGTRPSAEPINPYAPPAVPQGYQAAWGDLDKIPGGVWRQGRLLVMHKRAQLPAICVKSNQPSSQWLQRKLSWHEPWISVTILAGVLVYVILAVILTKRATIHIGLTDEWVTRRRTRMIVCWVVGLAFLALIPAAFGLAAATEQEGWLILLLVGFIGSLTALIAGQSLVSMVTPQRITDDYVWLKGANREFLNRLPEFPYRV
jgi:hypothetical protein